MTASKTTRWQQVATTTVLITGSGERADRLAATLRAAGHGVTVLDPATVLGGDPAALSSLPSSVHSYLQLPTTVPLRGDNLVGRVRSFLADGLLARFALVEQILPMLDQHASVALVAGNVAGTASGTAPVPDDQHSRLALLHVLAHATRAELTHRYVRVQVIAGDRLDDEILDFLLVGGNDTRVRLLDDSVAPSDKEYQDWRTEVMGLMSQA